MRVRACVRVCVCRDIISDKTMYMHSEDSDKLVNLCSLISGQNELLTSSYSTTDPSGLPYIISKKVLHI